jgi:hypothetical protein
MVARWTADTMTESLYHNLIQLKCLPFLPDELHTKECLELHSVAEVMSAPAVTLPLFGPVADVARALMESRHAAFPVVEPGMQGGDVFKVRRGVGVWVFGRFNPKQNKPTPNHTQLATRHNTSPLPRPIF